MVGSVGFLDELAAYRRGAMRASASPSHVRNTDSEQGCPAPPAFTYPEASITWSSVAITGSRFFSCRPTARCSTIWLRRASRGSAHGPLVQRIAGRYARRLQRRLPTTGHLFEGRYRAVLVDADDHLLRLTRYIHLNPLRAGMVADPANYPWSGHLACLGIEDVPWLTTDLTLRVLGADVTSARRAYARMIALGGDPDDSVQNARPNSG